MTYASSLITGSRNGGLRYFAAGGLAAGLCALLGGCATSGATADGATQALAGTRLHGSIHGGQQPVAGATLQLYAAGSSGYGSGYPYATGSSLLGSNVVTTDASGDFNLPAYTCPTASTEVYLVATGGNPGLGTGNNPNLALEAALGPCGELTSATDVSINELTTVASVYALSPFMTGIANVGTSATNAVGLTNAFAAVNKLVNTAAGQLPGPALAAGATIPIAKINTLADAIAACINSAGGAASNPSTPCGQLFAATTVGGVSPTDTITAAMVIAQHPNANVAAITNLASATAPFQPTLQATPTDLNLVISYSAGALSSPQGVAVDAAGDVWVTNATGNTVTEMNNAGTLLSGAAGFSGGSLNQPSAIAIDTSGNAWIANRGNNTVSEITSSGNANTAFSGGGLSTPSGVAIDAYSNVWIANYGNSSVTKIGSAGSVTSYATSGVTSPVGIAINPK